MVLPLQLEEAVPLGYAVVARLAEDAGVRVLAIKGPVLALQGLRPPRTSVDVDVLVEPAGLSLLAAALERIGWHDGGFYDTPTIVPTHSVNHRHPLWPCELDVHHQFPGFLADPADVFDVLWGRRSHVQLAHRRVEAPDPAAHAAIAALHYLRDDGQGTRRADLDQLVALLRGWPAAAHADLADLAADTGSAQSLEPLLAALGVTGVRPARALVTPVSDWRMRTQAHTSAVLPWIVGLRRAPWWQRPAYLWRAVFLDARQFRAPGESRVPRGRELAAARMRRLRRGFRALPASVSDYRRLRRTTRG